MSKFNIFFRADSSEVIGTGHISRCINLANSLEDHPQVNSISFICSTITENQISILNKNNFSLNRLIHDEDTSFPPQQRDSYESWCILGWEKDAKQTIDVLNQKPESGKKSLLICDHYGLDSKWEKKIAETTGVKILAIDDLANRPHFCDYLLDHNHYDAPHSRYENLLEKQGCHLMLGATYAMLNKNLATLKSTYKQRTNNIFACFGGFDPTHETLKLLKAIKACPKSSNFTFDIVFGALSTKDFEIATRDYGDIKNIKIHKNPPNIYQLIRDSFFAFGSGGTMTWERIILETPAAVTAVAKNQEFMCESLSDREYIDYLGSHQVTTPASYSKTLEKLDFQAIFYLNMLHKNKEISQSWDPNNSVREIFSSIEKHED